jgi:hypothetical protein
LGSFRAGGIERVAPCCALLVFVAQNAFGPRRRFLARRRRS